MSLIKYREKRNFSSTPEPTSGKGAGSRLSFVIQKHAASHLHYDFRLEVKGVLKSWAVPKGPVLDPSIKRLAMLVEDHPYDYKDFEGIIPKGNYGAGTVIVWDAGWYEPASGDAGTKAEQEKQMLKDFYRGEIKINMHGKKLKGRFALVRTKRGEDDQGKNWLLIKDRDEYATTNDIALNDKSVKSGKTLEQMAKSKGAASWQSNRTAVKKSKASARRKAIIEDEPADLADQARKGVKSAMPVKIAPMLCTLTKEVEQDTDYQYEVKWDGYRVVAFAGGRSVQLHSRSGLDYTAKYPNVVKALKASGHKMVLDGEMVVFNEEGMPDFDALQNYNGKETPISYCVFDILWLDGYDLKGLPLTERKAILQEICGDSDTLKFSESFDDGEGLYTRMVDMNLEGIVAKKKDSPYSEGVRGNDWLKTPTRKRQEFVIGGWAESDKARSFRSILFGAYNPEGQLEWIGRSGGGYKEAEMPGILKKLQALETKTSPFVNKVLDTKGAKIHWVKPKLVGNFEFATWTKSGRIRKPATWLGFRRDKKPLDVVREVPKAVTVIEEENKKEEAELEKAETQNDSNWPTLEKIRITSESTLDIDGCPVTLTNVERNVWKGIPKATLIRYYNEMADYILPYLKDRPLSLHIKYAGASAKGFYIKDMEGREPECAEIFSDKRRHPKPGKRDTIDYIVCNNKPTLIYLVNLGCIDLNPWMSRIGNPLEPDFINIDLDPSDEDFDKAIEAAQAAHRVLDRYKLKSFVKTSGKTGIHIYIPVRGITFPQARHYSETLGAEVVKLIPRIATTVNSVSARGRKIYIDPSQNDYADTLASAYSVRPAKTPTVSTPLDWKEVRSGLDPSRFTIETIQDRLRKKGDLFESVLDEKIAKANAGKIMLIEK